MHILSYKDLVVWQKAKLLAVLVYATTKEFPAEEKYGLISQMRRAVVSIPSNIAEGRARRSRKDFVQFLYIASGSVAELETQLEIASDLKYIHLVTYNELIVLLVEIRRMIASMISKLKVGT